MFSEQNVSKIKKLILILVPLFSFLLGSGIIWNWMNLKIEKERTLFQKQQIEMQKEKNFFEKLRQLASLNEKLTERFFLYAKLNEEYIILLREYDIYDQTDQIEAGGLEHKIKVNRSQSSILLEEIIKLENDIATLENRTPRDLGSKVPLLPPLIKLEIK